MEEPDFQEALDILSLRSARQILRAIIGKAKSVQEILEELEDTDFPIKYRSSVFKSLEKMVLAGLVEKIREENAVKYRSRYSSVTADLIQGKLNLKRGKK
jgi:Fe2+ or Zn2+ uptake regulation protein